MSPASNRLAYQRRGSGAAVVLLHGIPGQGRIWEEVADFLTDSFDVVVVDLIGFGESERPSRPSIATIGPVAQAGAVAALLDELEVRAATIVGHDYGAPIGLLLAAERPDLVGALALLSGNTFPDTPIPFPLSLANAPIVGSLFSRVLFSAPSLRLMLRQGTGPGATPPDAEIYIGDSRQRNTIATIFSAALRHLAEMYTPVASALRGVEVPVLVGWGDRDPFFPIEQAERTAAVANARLRVFDGAGHFLPHERPSELAVEIAKLAATVDR